MRIHHVSISRRNFSPQLGLSTDLFSEKLPALLEMQSQSEHRSPSNKSHSSIAAQGVGCSPFGCCRTPMSGLIPGVFQHISNAAGVKGRLFLFRSSLQRSRLYRWAGLQVEKCYRRLKIDKLGSPTSSSSHRCRDLLDMMEIIIAANFEV
jgi:hypothetical protein